MNFHELEKKKTVSICFMCHKIFLVLILFLINFLLVFSSSLFMLITIYLLLQPLRAMLITICLCLGFKHLLLVNLVIKFVNEFPRIGLEKTKMFKYVFGSRKYREF